MDQRGVVLMASEHDRPPRSFDEVGDPWVERCPKGHAGIRWVHTLGLTRCRSCGVFYAGRPVDARDVESFPLDESEYHVVKEVVNGE